MARDWEMLRRVVARIVARLRQLVRHQQLKSRFIGGKILQRCDWKRAEEVTAGAAEALTGIGMLRDLVGGRGEVACSCMISTVALGYLLTHFICGQIETPRMFHVDKLKPRTCSTHHHFHSQSLQPSEV